MVIKKNIFLTLIGLGIVFIVVLYPAILSLFLVSDKSEIASVSSPSSIEIVLRTLIWSIVVGIVATAIGWPVGIRLVSLKRNTQRALLAMFVMTLIIPAYAIFYVWWQAWPSGTWLHAIIVEYGYLGVASKMCLAIALIAWSWPIPALISSMVARSDNSLSILNQLDNTSIFRKGVLRIQKDIKIISVSILIVAAITASNTTCFDLAQVVTIGNELRSVIASGNSIFSVPLLSFSGLIIAVISAVLLIRFSSKSPVSIQANHKTAIPILILWFALSGLPLFVTFIITKSNVVEFIKLYQGDIAKSLLIALGVACASVLILIASATMHLSSSSTTKTIAKGIDFSWIVVAFLPASIVVSFYSISWHSTGIEWMYRTPVILIFAHLTKVGFVASLGGKWVASCSSLKTLFALDNAQSMKQTLTALFPRLVISCVVIVGVSFAVSLSEVALTNQLSPPSTNQPIAVALLNAMHYQRPQTVTAALLIVILVAGCSGLVVAFANRKLVALLFIVCIGSCNSYEQNPIADAIQIGGAGRSDGRFTTPRAIATNNDVVVVIDKSGRLQKFNHDGVFLSSWELELSGTGYPTGVSIDSDGSIWIADTHQQRILVMNQDGKELFHFGSYGTEDGQFLYPTDIAFGKQGEVFVSEYGGNERINVFNRSGEFQYAFGHFGSDEEGFIRPQSIAISPTTGNLFITDAGNHRIVERTPKGDVVQIIASAGREIGELLYPYGIVFDSDNSIIVCEFGNNRLQRFSTNGEVIEVFGGAGDTNGLFKTPWAIEIVPNGFIVADTGNNRLQRLPDMMAF